MQSDLVTETTGKDAASQVLLDYCMTFCPILPERLHPTLSVHTQQTPCLPLDDAAMMQEPVMRRAFDRRSSPW